MHKRTRLPPGGGRRGGRCASQAHSLIAAAGAEYLPTYLLIYIPPSTTAYYFLPCSEFVPIESTLGTIGCVGTYIVRNRNVRSSVKSKSVRLTHTIDLGIW